jgi:hypothetical protein
VGSRLGYELRTLHLQSRSSTDWATPPVHFLVILEMGSWELFAWLALNCAPPISASQVARVTGVRCWHPAYYFLTCRGYCFFAPSFVSESFFSHSWLLLNLTGLNWGQLEISEKTQDRQTDRKWGQECWALGWRCPTLIAFLYLDSLRPCSLQFFKTLLLKSSLKPCRIPQ